MRSRWVPKTGTSFLWWGLIGTNLTQTNQWGPMRSRWGPKIGTSVWWWGLKGTNLTQTNQWGPMRSRWWPKAEISVWRWGLIGTNLTKTNQWGPMRSRWGAQKRRSPGSENQWGPMRCSLGAEKRKKLWWWGLIRIDLTNEVKWGSIWMAARFWKLIWKIVSWDACYVIVSAGYLVSKGKMRKTEEFSEEFSVLSENSSPAPHCSSLDLIG